MPSLLDKKNNWLPKKSPNLAHPQSQVASGGAYALKLTMGPQNWQRERVSILSLVVFNLSHILSFIFQKNVIIFWILIPSIVMYCMFFKPNSEILIQLDHWSSNVKAQ